MAEWLQAARARFEAAPERIMVPVRPDFPWRDVQTWADVMRDVPRLLAAAEALAELVALRDDPMTAPRKEARPEWQTAWERARAALAQGGGDAPGDRPSRAHLPG